MRYETSEVELTASAIRTRANLYQVERSGYGKIPSDFYKLIYLLHKYFYEQYFVQLKSLYYPKQSDSEDIPIYANEISKMAEDNLVKFINTSIHKGQNKKIIPLKRSNLNYLSGTEVCFLNREFAKYSTTF